MRTEIMIHPTLEEVKRLAAHIGLPAIEAEKFFNHYCSNGWRVGRNPMKSFPHAMANWKLNWEQRYGGNNGSGTGPIPNSAADRTIKSKELERVIQEISEVRAQVGQDALGRKHYQAGQLERIKRLIAVRDKLRRELGL